MIGMASVVTKSPLPISSNRKSERMIKGNTRPLPIATTSISISVFSSYSNWRIPFTVAETRLQCTPYGYVRWEPAGEHNSQDTGGYTFGGRANWKHPKNPEEPTPEECNNALDKMQLLNSNDPLFEVACRIFHKSKEHRKEWMLLCQKPVKDKKIKEWIELTGKELGIYE
ncbi:hypothetical protein RHGRI_038945 [Rhododendron griersonianum]|uniref:Uncharacterized protein n=1 Tax=Rhododendron griersonianum TaxID=479676 RepID=A0AAV6HN51_9ERIC|nr:hypothetical protein RHGRI_038945 [Rhododendron griersonianum]